jgi:hypothetical protein
VLKPATCEATVYPAPSHVEGLGSNAILVFLFYFTGCPVRIFIAPGVAPGTIAGCGRA